MRLKNTDELRRRAKAHRRMDNYVSGTYGGNALAGDPNEIEACGIACLAAPHQKGRFAALIKRVGLQMWRESSERDRLAQEFGICKSLSYVIEYGFESEDHEDEGERADFIVAVTEAMADGVDVRPRDGHRFENEMTRADRNEFIRWLAEKCDRPIPAYAREAVAA